MSRLIESNIKTHRNIYSEITEKRQIPVRIGVPDHGIDENTNMLVISYGYGADYKANIFSKLMHILPDKYNLAVVCGYYFGAVFLNESNLIMDQKKECYIEADETEKEFNDMGIMQALDTVYMTLAALDYIGREAHELKHIFIFGSSHGGYIAHLANLLCPGLYTYLIDISAYLFPHFMNYRRMLTETYQNGDEKDFIIEYLVSRRPDLRYDRRVYDLKYLYRTSDSSCRILAFQGKDDWMVDWQEKYSFIKELGDKAEILLFGNEDVDGGLIKNAYHGLGMDFLWLFDTILPMFSGIQTFRESLRTNEVILGKGELDLVIDYKTSKPVWKPENNRWIESCKTESTVDL